MAAKLDLNSSLSLTLRRGRGKCRWTRKRSVVNACWLRNTWKTDMNKCHRLLVVSITSARYSFVFAHFLYELGLLRLCRTYWSGDKQLITTQWCIIDPWLSAYVVWQSTSFDPNVAHTSDSGVAFFFFLRAKITKLRRNSQSERAEGSRSSSFQWNEMKDGCMERTFHSHFCMSRAWRDDG